MLVENAPGLGFGCVQRALKPQWLRLSTRCFKSFLSHFIKPSIALAFAFTIPLISYDLVMHNIRSHTGAYNGLSDILISFGLPMLLYIGLSLLALAAVLWGFGALLFAMTVFCRTFLELNPQNLPLANADLDKLIDDSKQSSLVNIRSRKSFLFAVWLTYSIIVLVPFIVMQVAGTVLALGMPAVNGLTILPITTQIPQEMTTVAGIIFGITTIAISNYTLILMPLSSILPLSGRRVAVQGFMLTLKALPLISVYSAIVTLLSTVLFSPIDLVVIFNVDLGTNVWMRYLLFTLRIIGHTLFFAVLVPVTMLFPCEMVRGNSKCSRQGQSGSEQLD